MSYYKTNPKRIPLLGHCSFGVTSISISEPFYTAILAPFGVQLVFKSSDSKCLGYGHDDREPINIFEVPTSQVRAAGKGTHLALNAPSRSAVDEFYKAALENGGKGDGAPGVREEYHENYYACFVFDPDGHRLEAVYQQPESTKEGK